MVQNCNCVFTDGTCDCVMVIFILYRTVAVCLLTVRVLCYGNIYMVQDCSSVFTDSTCDCVMVIYIWYRNVALCLLTVRVTVLW